MCLGCLDPGGPKRCPKDTGDSVVSKQNVCDELAQKRRALQADLALIEHQILNLNEDSVRRHLEQTSNELHEAQKELEQLEDSLPPASASSGSLDEARQQYAQWNAEQLRAEIDSRTHSEEFAQLIADRDAAREQKLAAQERFDDVSKTVDDNDAGSLSELQEARNALYDAHCNLQVANAPLEAYKDHTAQAAKELSERIDLREWEGDTLGELYKHSEHPEGSREWLEDRQEGFGGSDIGVLTGEDKDAYRTSTDIKNQKLLPITDEQVAQQEAEMAAGTGPAGRGHAWERVIVADYAKDHPDDTVLHTKATWRHPDRAYTNVNVDSLLSSDGGETVDGIMDAKTGADAAKFANGIPVGYRCQLGYYLHNAGLKRGVIAAKIDDGPTQYFTMHVDEPLNGQPGGKTIADYDEKLAAKWAQIEQEKQNPPGPKPNKATFAWVKQPKSESSHAKNEAIARDLAAYRGISTQTAKQLISNNIYEGDSADSAVRKLYTNYDPSGSDRRFVTLDFETNSRSAGKGEVIQTGVVVTDASGNVIERIDELHGIDPRIKDLQGTGETSIHNISPADVEGKKPFQSSEAHERIKTLLAHPGSTLIAHNAQFEKNWLRANGIGAPRVIDTMRLRQRFSHNTVGATNEAFCRDNGVEYVNAHNAAADADMTSRAFHHFAKKLFHTKVG